MKINKTPEVQHITDWFVKPSASSTVMNFDSNHSLSQEPNVIHNLKNRIKTISYPNFHDNNKDKLKLILQENG